MELISCPDDDSSENLEHQYILTKLQVVRKAQLDPNVPSGGERLLNETYLTGHFRFGGWGPFVKFLYFH
jgi:hypothetical protein